MTNDIEHLKQECLLNIKNNIVELSEEMIQFVISGIHKKDSKICDIARDVMIWTNLDYSRALDYTLKSIEYQAVCTIVKNKNYIKVV